MQKSRNIEASIAKSSSEKEDFVKLLRSLHEKVENLEKSVKRVENGQHMSGSAPHGGGNHDERFAQVDNDIKQVSNTLTENTIKIMGFEEVVLKVAELGQFLQNHIKNSEGSKGSEKKSGNSDVDTDERLSTLENILGQGPFKHSQPTFNPNDCHKRIKFKNTNKTLITPENFWISTIVFGDEAIPKKGKLAFSFRFGNGNGGNDSMCCLGVTLSGFNDINTCSLTPGCYFLDPFKKKAYLNGNIIDYTGTDLNGGGLVVVMIDFDHGLICFKINDTPVARGKVDLAGIKDKDLFPCIALNNYIGVEISLV